MAASCRDQQGLSYGGLEVVYPPASLEATSYHSDPGIEVYHDPNSWRKTATGKVAIARPSSRDAPEVLEAYQEHVDGHLPPPAATICGIRSRIFWVVTSIIAFIVVAGAIGGGIGGHFTSKSSSSRGAPTADGSDSSTPGSNTTAPASNTTTSARPAFPDLSIAALGWTDTNNVRQVRVYTTTPSNSTNPSRILESSWDSGKPSWSVEAITDPVVDSIKLGTPLASSAGNPHTNASIALVKNVYFLQSTGKVAERQSPYKEQTGIWGYDNFSGLYTASDLSAVFSYWYQNFDTRVQVLTNFFQELGANSLTAARYVENVTGGRDWESTRHSILIQDGSSLAAAPAGHRRDLRLYVGGTDGTMKQYPYNVEIGILGTVTDTAFDLPPGTPLCVTTEDNRNYFTDKTMPECARTRGAFITHLILFASADRQDLNLISWNCSSGFLAQKNRVRDLLKPGRTYLALTATPQMNLTFVDQRVYVMYTEGSGQLKMEEWQVPASGGVSGRVIPEQNGPLKLLGEVPIALP